MKVINLGAHKTGTTSLTILMRSIGYNAQPISPWVESKEYQGQVKKGDYSRVVRSLSSQYNFFADSPYCIGDVWKSLDLPGIKFILTIRESHSWYDSYLRWAEARSFVKDGVSNTWLGYDKPILEQNRGYFITKYERRNLDIMDYFKKRICVLPVELESSQKIDRLSRFLGREINFHYPHKNRTI